MSQGGQGGTTMTPEERATRQQQVKEWEELIKQARQNMEDLQNNLDMMEQEHARLLDELEAPAAFGTDYLEKSFAGWPRSYPDGMGEDENDALAYAPSGFIWDNVLAHGVQDRAASGMNCPVPEVIHAVARQNIRPTGRQAGRNGARYPPRQVHVKAAGADRPSYLISAVRHHGGIKTLQFDTFGLCGDDAGGTAIAKK